MVKILLHLWLVIYYIYGWYLLHLWLVLHLWSILTFTGDTAEGKPVGYLTGEIEIWTRDNRKKIQLEAIKGGTITQGCHTA